MLHPGEVAPFEGVLLSTPVVAELAATLDQCMSTVDAEKANTAAQVAVERKACEARVKVIEDTAKEREAVLKAALDASQAKEREAAAATTDAEIGRYFWAAGGVAAGLVVGIVVGGGVILYLDATTRR